MLHRHIGIYSSASSFYTCATHRANVSKNKMAAPFTFAAAEVLPELVDEGDPDPVLELLPLLP